MLVAVVRFPHVPAERDADFREWFGWSNDQLSDAVGLSSRRLLHGDGMDYVALVEHESAATFAQMHGTAVAKEVQRRLHQVLDDEPQAEMYEVVEDATVRGCCGGRHHTGAEISAEVSPAVQGGCCQASA